MNVTGGGVRSAVRMGCCCSREDTKKSKRSPDNAMDQSQPRSIKSEKKSFVKRSRKGDRRFVALWDYKPESKAELNLVKGEQLEEEMEERDAGPEWVFVSKVGAKSGTGYAPRRWLGEIGSLEVESCFFGTLNRKDAEKVLEGMPDGTFIVRSRQRGQGVEYAVSVSHENGVKHYRVKMMRTESSEGDRRPNMHYFLGKRKFESVIDMVRWFQKSADGICCLLSTSPGRPMPERIELPADVQKNWQEIPRKQITVEKDIGKGNFGVVRKGIWKPTPAITLEVAVKELKPGTTGARKQFLQEAVAMKNLVHERLVKLHGVVSAEEPFWIITEFVKDGALKGYLRKRDKEQAWLEEAVLVNISTQVADGMRYLEAKEVVHRDLAARNVLVDEKKGLTEKDIKFDIKIADFGMAKMTQKGRGVRERGAMELAAKWAAPESLSELRFFTASDVWSFGVLLHEIFTHGGEPYKGVTPRQVKDYVVKDRRVLDRAEGVPEKIYDLMVACFHFEYRSRPTFQDIFDILEKFYEKGADPYERYRQLTAAVSIENCLLVVFPVHAKLWCTMRNAWIAIGVCSLSALLLHSFNLICREITPIWCFDSVSMNISEKYAFQIVDAYSEWEGVYYWCSGVSTICIPMLIMVTATVLINYHLIWTRSEISRGAEQKRCVVRLSFVTALCHVVFEMPHLAVLIIAAKSGSAQETIEDGWPTGTQSLATASNFLTQINASIPFVVYFLCSKRFRQLFVITMGGTSGLDTPSTTVPFSRASVSHRRSEVIIVNNSRTSVGQYTLTTFNQGRTARRNTNTTDTNTTLAPPDVSKNPRRCSSPNQTNHRSTPLTNPTINITSAEDTGLLERETANP